VKDETTMSSEQPSADRMIDRLRSAPARHRRELLADFLHEQLAYALGVEKGDVDRDDGLMNLGMDSLKAVEAKLYLEDELGIELESALLFDHPTIDALTSFLLGALAVDAPAEVSVTSPAVRQATGALTGEAADVLDDLSADDIARLLSAELASIPRVDRGRADD
jgi:acyl carrier protein